MPGMECITVWSVSLNPPAVLRMAVLIAFSSFSKFLYEGVEIVEGAVCIDHVHSCVRIP